MDDLKQITLSVINIGALVLYAMLTNFFFRVENVTRAGSDRMRALAYFFATYFIIYLTATVFESILNVPLNHELYGEMRPFLWRGMAFFAALWLTYKLYSIER